MSAKDHTKKQVTDGLEKGMRGGTIETEEMTADTEKMIMKDAREMIIEGEKEMAATGEGKGLPIHAMSQPKKRSKRSKKLRLKKCSNKLVSKFIQIFISF